MTTIVAHALFASVLLAGLLYGLEVRDPAVHAWWRLPWFPVKLRTVSDALDAMGLSAAEAAEGMRQLMWAFTRVTVERVSLEDDPLLLDAHAVSQEEREDDRCWASAGDWSPCNRQATSDVGLCEDHLADLREDSR